VEVAHLLAEAEGDENLVAAGYLHDTVEDTMITPVMLEAEFGDDITRLVLAATDDKALPSAERKRLQIEHAPHKKPREANLKLADKISNLRSLAMAPPAGWPPERFAAYVAWAHEVVTRLPGTHGYLMERYWEIRRRLQGM
jgi:GTP diphosphokinase / guanosine-3',5'-bis(diphosphate) 3'-diphosphatase